MNEKENKNNENIEFEEIADKYVIEANETDAPKSEFTYSEPEEDKPVPKGYSIASMVLGIISVVCCCVNIYPFFFFIPLIFGILALVFRSIAKKNGANDGMAIAGFICGIIGIIIAVLGLIISVLIICGLIYGADEAGTTLLI